MNENLVIALAALLIGFSKGGLGGPVPISLTAPLLATQMEVPEAIGLMLPLLLFADVFALKVYWMKWEMRYFKLLMPTALIGIVIGSALLGWLPEEILRRSMGVFVLTIVGYKLISDRLESVTYEPRSWHGYFAGWLAGFGSSIANAGSPPFTAYMLLHEVSPVTFIGTTTWFFAVLNILKLPLYLMSGVIDGHRLLGIYWAVPIIPAGVWIGRKLIDRINAKAFELLMLGLLALMSIYLIAGG